MEQTKTDPRTLRTRKFIIDAFLTLSSKRDFTDISVKDITEEAMINRATFYNHFVDKYDLLEQVVSERLSFSLNCEVKQQNVPIEKTIEEVFLSLVAFEESVHTYCKTSEEKETIDRILQAELSRIFSNMLMEHGVAEDVHVIRRLAKIVTNTVVGMSVDWMKSNKVETPKEYLKPLMPFILNGLMHY